MGLLPSTIEVTGSWEQFNGDTTTNTDDKEEENDDMDEDVEEGDTRELCIHPETGSVGY